VAREFQIPIEGVQVRVSHKQNLLVGGPNDPRQRQLRITELYRQISVRGPVTEEQRERLLWGAEHCPVHNSIGAAIPIRTALEVLQENASRG